MGKIENMNVYNFVASAIVNRLFTIPLFLLSAFKKDIQIIVRS